MRRTTQYVSPKPAADRARRRYGEHMGDARKLLQLSTTVIGASLQRCKHHGANQYHFSHLLGLIPRGPHEPTCTKEVPADLVCAIATMWQT
jgi:hypothetical protein